MTPRSSSTGGTTQPAAGEPQSAPGTSRTRSESPLLAGVVAHVLDVAAEQDGDGRVAVLLGDADVLDQARRDLGLCRCGQRQQPASSRSAADCRELSHQSNFESVMRCSGPERRVRIVVSVESV